MVFLLKSRAWTRAAHRSKTSHEWLGCCEVFDRSSNLRKFELDVQLIARDCARAASWGCFGDRAKSSDCRDMDLRIYQCKNVLD